MPPGWMLSLMNVLAVFCPALLAQVDEEAVGHQSAGTVGDETGCNVEVTESYVRLKSTVPSRLGQGSLLD